MSNFQETLEQVLVLSTFIPLIISSGGNSGSQAATLIIQAMALGEVEIKDWWRIASREIISGFINGSYIRCHWLFYCLWWLPCIRIIWRTFYPDRFCDWLCSRWRSYLGNNNGLNASAFIKKIGC